MTKSITHQTYKTVIHCRKHQIEADEPLELGGSDEGMTPKELLHSSLAACTGITLRMYIDRKDWPVESIEIHIEELEDEAGEYLQKRMLISGQVNQTQLERMLTISNKCPVYKIVHQGIRIESKIELI